MVMHEYSWQPRTITKLIDLSKRIQYHVDSTKTYMFEELSPDAPKSRDELTMRA